MKSTGPLEILRAVARGDAETARTMGHALALQVVGSEAVRLAFEVLRGGEFIDARIVELCEAVLDAGGSREAGEGAGCCVIYVKMNEGRPDWVVVRDWYIAVARELEEIAKNGGVRTKAGVFNVSEKARKKAEKQAVLHREAAEIVHAEGCYDGMVSRTLPA